MIVTEANVTYVSTVFRTALYVLTKKYRIIPPSFVDAKPTGDYRLLTLQISIGIKPFDIQAFILLLFIRIVYCD